MSDTNPALSKAWTAWNETIEEMRAAIEATPRYREHPEHRAQAIYSLIEAQTMAYNQVIAPRPTQPRIFTPTSWNTHLYTLGQQATDGLYGFLLLDGRKSYTVRGRLGEICIMLMQAYSAVLGHPESELLGNFDFTDFADDDGKFEVRLSAERGDAEHWIPLSAESEMNYILLRRFFSDWYADMGELELVVDGGVEPHDFTDEEALARRIEAAAGFVEYLVSRWTIGLHDFYLQGTGGVNRLDYVSGDTIIDLAGSPSTYYGWGVVEAGPDDAVIVEQELPNSAYWSFQLGDVWSKPIDSMYHQSDVNMRRAVPDADGRVRAVISQEDPGVPNWMDPAGRSTVLVVTRNYREQGKVDPPTVTTIKLADLRQHLPADTATITPEQRARDLEYRRLGYLRLYEGAARTGDLQPA